ncbi:MAG: sucrose-6F-phosphate phosphohydrolase [Parasphingorhabdus sp.]|jgi:sucrose-6F-phosphate phosphohydrolase
MNEAILICTDLDRTLIPNGSQPDSANARERFQQLVSQQQIKLAYVSGRDQQLVQKAMRLYQLPQPDFVIGDVGTTLYGIAKNGDWQAIKEWHHHINNDWNGYTNSQIRALIHHPDLRLQEIAKQNDHKLSYYFPLSARQQNMTESIHIVLSKHGIKANLIWSTDEPNGIGLLDIVPAHASKYLAIDYLLKSLKMNPSRCVFCGDSGNDMEVLVSPINAVLVANSMDDIKQQALNAVIKSASESSLYIAQGGFMDMNGNYCAGMLEGIHHYFPETTN